MELQCSCSACSSLSCLARRACPPYLFSPKGKPKPYLFFDKIDKKISTFSLNNCKLEQKLHNGYEDMKFSIDTLKFTETPQQSCENPVKDKEHNFSHMASSYITMRPSAAKLSAQIMNVPLKDLEDSFRRHEPAPRTEVSRLMPFDIFEKIKEVYKACSCKVCECIVGKPQKNEVCNCKPCECDECNTFKKKVTISNNFTSLDVAKAASNCLRLEESLFKRLTNKELKQNCDCKPCECIECTDRVKVLSTPCACEQSVCVECNTRYTSNKYQELVVAAVGSDNPSRQECSCNSCACPQCSHRQVAAPTMTHEMSTETTQPEACRCDTCLSEACAPEGINICTCERSERITRKPTQRNNDYDIHRSLITQRNPCRHDLIAMFAAISKIFPDAPIQKCNSEHTCKFCNYKSNCDNTVKSSEFVISDINESKTYETLKSSVISSSFNDEFAAKKTVRNGELQPFHSGNLEKASEIKMISKFSSNNTCRYSPCDYVNVDDMVATCTGDVCDCTHCKCERCVSKDDGIYPIKRGENLLPSIFKNKMNSSVVTFSDEKINDANKTPLKRTRTRPSGTTYRINSHIDSDIYDNLHIEYDKHNVNTKFKKVHRVQPFTDSTKLKRTFSKSSSVKFQATSSGVVSDLPISITANNDSNPQFVKKYQEENLNTADYNCYKDPIPYPRKRTTYLSDFDCADKCAEVKRPRLDIDSENNLKVSNIHNHDKAFPEIETLSSRVAKHYKNRVGYNKNNEEYNNLSINVSSQCVIGVISKTSNKLDVAKSVDENKICTFSKINLTCSEIINRPVLNYKSTEKYEEDNHEDVPAVHTPDNVEEAASNEFDQDEDYIRVRKTINDARNFSLHLMDLLEKYEKANKEFESIYQKLARSSNTVIVHNTPSVLNKISCNTNATTDNYSFDYPPTVYFHNVATQITIAPASDSIVESKQYHRTNKDEISNMHSQSIHSSNSFKGHTNMVLSGKKFKRFSGQKHENNLTTVYGNIENTERKLITGKNIDNSCFDDEDRITEFKHNSSNTFSFGNSELFDDFINYDDRLFPISETNTATTQFNIPIKKRNIKKKSRSYSKMYKQVVMVSKRKNLFVPTYGKRSSTTETFSNLVDEINENGPQFDIMSKDNESKLSVVGVQSEEDENGFNNDSEPQLSIRSQNTHRVAKLIESPKSIEAKISKIKKSLGRTSESSFELIRKHSLGKGIKEAVKAIKQASMTWESNYVKTHQGVGGRHENVALVQKCESMKVSYVTARKLPDDTVVVKWQVPETLEHVQGYEVLVNGKSMQKIPDKTCDESILSGLQDSDKYLVSVRTVTNRKCSSGCYPTATTVYWPGPAAVCCS